MPKRRRTASILLLTSAIGLLIIGGAFLYLSLVPQITVNVAGTNVRLRGRFDTVGGALEAAGMTLRPEDFIWPALNEPLPAAGTINVLPAAPVELSVDGEVNTVWTQQTNLASFLAEQGVRLRPTSSVRLKNLGVPLTSILETKVEGPVSVTSLIDVTISENNETFSVHTQAASVGQVLAEEGFNVHAADSVKPSLNTRLESGQVITVEQAAPVIVTRGDQKLVARTSVQDVANALAEMGVGLIGRQRSVPRLDQPLTGDETIRVLEHTTTYEVTETSIPYSSQLLALDSLELDQRSLVSTGIPGVKSQLARVEMIGSETISETLSAEWVSLPPVNEIIGYGTNIVVRTLDTPSGPVSYWRVVRMRVTAYTAASAGKSADHPSYGITASGRPAGFGVIAVDPDVIPFRSQVYIPGYGVGFAGDTGGGVRGRIIDLGYDEGHLESWNGYVDVYYLTPVPDSGQINYLLPSTIP